MRTGGRSAGARHEVAGDAGTAADLRRVAGRSGGEEPFAAPLRRTETPGEPKHAGPVDFRVDHRSKRRDQTPVRRSSASFRSIFLRAAIAFRLRFVDGFS